MDVSRSRDAMQNESSSSNSLSNRTQLPSRESSRSPSSGHWSFSRKTNCQECHSEREPRLPRGAPCKLSPERRLRPGVGSRSSGKALIPTANPQQFSQPTGRTDPHKNGSPAQAGIVIIPYRMRQCQFPLAMTWLRKCPGHKDGSILPCRTPGAHEKNHVLPALQVRLYLGKIIFAVY